MIPRCFAPDADRVGELIELSEDETGYLCRVLRLGDGDSLRVFNGKGREFEAHLIRANRGCARVQLDSELNPALEPQVRITLAVALLKGDAMDTVVREAVMLGVDSFQPVIASRTQTTPSTLAQGRRVERWRRVGVASARQCGRATVPIIHPVVDVGTVTSALRDGGLPEPAFLLVEPSARLETVSIAGVTPAVPACATLLVGPEGGWTPGELQSLSTVARPVTLGALTIRAEVAPVVALSALFARWEAF